MSENEDPWPVPIDLGGSERYYWMPLESFPDGALSLDAEGHIINCNEVICRLLGFSTSELRERNFCQLLMDTPEDQLSWVDRIKRDGKVEGELELVGHSGQKILVWTRAVALHNANGEVTRVVVHIQDITEQKKLDQLKDEFIGLVSHELRSPLTVIMGAISTALSESDYLPPEETRQLLQDAL